MKLSDFKSEDIEDVEEETEKLSLSSLSEADVKDVGEVTIADSIQAGARQGATMGFADEIGATMQAKFDAVMGNVASEDAKSHRQLDSAYYLYHRLSRRNRCTFRRAC